MHGKLRQQSSSQLAATRVLQLRGPCLPDRDKGLRLPGRPLRRHRRPQRGPAKQLPLRKQPGAAREHSLQLRKENNFIANDGG